MPINLLNSCVVPGFHIHAEIRTSNPPKPFATLHIFGKLRAFWKVSHMELAALARCLGISAPTTSLQFKRVTIDSRQVQAGDLFYAIAGEQFDGHQFVEAAAEKGAVAAVVERPMNASIPTLVVPNTRLALGVQAKAWRDQFSLRVIALTGSAGKTTVKEITASIMRQAGNTLATQGNFNNDLGVPLTLLNLTAEHQFAVIECGANHPGEIAYTTKLVSPDVALVNNVGAAHLEGFGSIEGVAKAKSEIYSGLTAKGCAIINADDHFADQYLSLCGQYRELTFGLNNPADITAENWVATETGWQFDLILAGERVNVTLPLPGQHNIRNALAACAAAFALGVSSKQIKDGLANVQGVAGRMQRKSGKQHSVIIDDTYNANPTSVRAAIDYLSQQPEPRLLILGDMGELGTDVTAHHHGVGEYAKLQGIRQLVTCGTHSAATANGFGEGALHFASQEQLIHHLQQHLQQVIPAHTHCLVKGSRSARMENIVNVLVEG